MRNTDPVLSFKDFHDDTGGMRHVIDVATNGAILDLVASLRQL